MLTCILQLAVLGLEMTNGITDGWSTHLVQEFWNILMISHWQHIEAIQSYAL